MPHYVANEDHWVFPKRVTENIRIWRYMDLSKLLSLLDTRALFFCRVDRLGDPFEATTPRASPVTRLPEFDRYRRENAVVNCWHVNEHESAAMWRLYLSGAEEWRCNRLIRS